MNALTSHRRQVAAVVIGGLILAVVVGAVIARHSGAKSETALRQETTSAAIARCRALADRSDREPIDPQVTADCTALLRGNPLEIQSLLNQAAAVGSLASGTTSSNATTSSSVRRPPRTSSSGYAATGVSAVEPEPTSSEPPSSTTPPPTQPPAPPCTAPSPLLCGLLP